MDTTIRPGRPADAPALASVFVAAARTGWAHLFPPAWFAELDTGPERFAAWLDGHERAEVTVAERGGEVIGFAVTRPSADDDAPGHGSTGQLHMLYTAPAVWGEGVGRALLSAAVEALARREFREATLWTALGNDRAIALYEANGWRRDCAARRRTLGGVELGEARLRRSLP